MSVSSTRKVSGSTSSVTKSSRPTGHGQGAFVEKIDSSNNVLIKDENNQEGHNQEPYQQKQDQEETVMVSDSPYISNAIEIQGNLEDTKKRPSPKSINAYNKNQSIKIEEEIDELI